MFERFRPDRFSKDTIVYLRTLIDRVVEEEQKGNNFCDVEEKPWRVYLLDQVEELIRNQDEKHNLIEIKHFRGMLRKNLSISSLKQTKNHPALHFDWQRVLTVYNFWLKNHGRDEFIRVYDGLFSGGVKRKRIEDRIKHLPSDIQPLVSWVYDGEESEDYSDDASSHLQFAKNVYMHGNWMWLYEKERAITCVLPELMLQIFTYCLHSNINMEEFFNYPNEDIDVSILRSLGIAGVEGRVSTNRFDILLSVESEKPEESQGESQGEGTKEIEALISGGDGSPLTYASVLQRERSRGFRGSGGVSGGGRGSGNGRDSGGGGSSSSGLVGGSGVGGSGGASSDGKKKRGRQKITLATWRT